MAKEPLKVVLEDPGRTLSSQSTPEKTIDTAVVCNPKMQEPKRIATHTKQALKPQVQLVFNQASTYRGPFFDALLARFLPDPSISIGVEGIALGMISSRNGALPISCSGWLHSAYDNSTRYGSDVLNEAMLAMAMCMVAVERNDMTLLGSAMRVYQRALVRVQKGLSAILSGSGISDASRELLPMSCLACTMTELIANRSIESASRHMGGIAMLIETNGIANLESSPIARLLFYEHRVAYVAYCFVGRRSCFYSKKEWMEFAMINNHHHAMGYFQTLLDIAYPVPELMEEYDSVGLASADHLHEMLERLRRFHHQIDRWKRNFEDAIGVPLWRVKETESENLFPNEIHFVAIGVAIALLYYYAFKIQLNQMMIDVTDDLATWGESLSAIRLEATNQSLEYANKVCRSLPYCFDKDKCVIGKLASLFPFESAWQTYERASNDPDVPDDYCNEMGFCRSTALRYRQMGIAVFNER